MTPAQLKEMFLAQEAWDREDENKDLIARLVDAIAALSGEITKLNELLKQHD